MKRPKEWPSLPTAIRSWRLESDEVILDHIRYWILKATEMGFSSFKIEFDEKRGTYICMVVR